AMMLRVFVAATSDGFAVMPGGLVRTAPAGVPGVVSMQRGGGCKDTWIVGDEGTVKEPAVAADQANVVPLRYAGDRREAAGELPSRAADGLFWVGRYAERSHGVIRLLRTLLLGVTDAARPWTMREVEPLLALAVSLDLVPSQELGRAPAQVLGLIPAIQSALTDPAHPNGASANLQRLANAAAGVRDRLPPDCWRIVTALARQPVAPVGRPAPARLLLRLDELVMLSAALWGAVDDNMTRDAGWRFLEIGKWLERAINLIAIIGSASAAALAADSHGRPIDEDRLLGAIFAVAGMRAPSVAQSDGTLNHAAALAALLTDNSNPFSLAFHIDALSAHLHALPPPSGWGPSTSLSGEAAITQALDVAQAARDRLITIADLVGPAAAPSSAPASLIKPLHAALAPIASWLPEISNLLTQAYLIHVYARQA
ncbi:MAG TPA: alpha-E domain-containing protein, partial [Stellaceae bacterium]|nr:alpha-E domain-containing protein [Stellaceae bacterium]